MIAAWVGGMRGVRGGAGKWAVTLHIDLFKKSLKDYYKKLETYQRIPLLKVRHKDKYC